MGWVNQSPDKPLEWWISKRIEDCTPWGMAGYIERTCRESTARLQQESERADREAEARRLRKGKSGGMSIWSILFWLFVAFLIFGNNGNGQTATKDEPKKQAAAAKLTEQKKTAPQDDAMAKRRAVAALAMKDRVEAGGPANANLAPVKQDAFEVLVKHLLQQMIYRMKNPPKTEAERTAEQQVLDQWQEAIESNRMISRNACLMAQKSYNPLLCPD